MKVFIADNRPHGKVDISNYHWCKDGEILMFAEFQKDNGNPKFIYMIGVETRKGTTNILVKDMDMDIAFYKELLSESIEKSMQTSIDEGGNYSVNVEPAPPFNFNINDMVEELLNKASKFEDGQKVKCWGRTLTESNP